MIILATTYAVNPNKGSEDGMGWNFVLQIARYNKVIAITRKNNEEAICKYMEEHPSVLYENITFKYFDLPYWMRFWKRKEKGAMLYYYLWQLFIPLFILTRKLQFDIVHNVNFHNDWTPSFLWVTGKPLVWGPIGHHPIIKNEFLKDYSWKIRFKNKINWVIKNTFWKLDPFLKLTKWQAKKIICMNSSVLEKIKGIEKKHIILPSVGSELNTVNEIKRKSNFEVLSIGRLVPLKGFDLTIKSFNEFLKTLSYKDKVKAKLTIVGSGTQDLFYKEMVVKLGIEKQVEFISWINREDLKEIYNRASIFLFPSHEGAGMVVSEALSYGLPVVTLNNCGPGEFITKKSGISVEQTSYKETITKLSDAILTLFHDKDKLQKMSKNACKQHENYFSWDRKGDLLHCIYNEIKLSRVVVNKKQMVTN
jgi:glycosyltransferase involved in cell wall biosynthesis